MLALRSLLLIDAFDEAALAAATRSAADAVVVDLAGPAAVPERAAARAAAVRHARALAQAHRPVVARLSDARSGELDADVEAVAGPWLAGAILAAVDQPQDIRDVDVQLRKQEMRRRLTPGGIVLLAEVDSAAGLAALPRTLAAVDRSRAVLLDADGLRADLGLDATATRLLEHAMAQVALIARAAGVPWVLRASSLPAAPSLAHEYGAAGVVIHREGEVRGANSLLALDAAEVARARAVLDAWERIRASEARTGLLDGAGPHAGPVDLREAQRARALLERAEAIARRESAT